jgi:glyoxalase family protein
MEMKNVREYAAPATDGSSGETTTVRVYQMADGGPHAELHVAIEPGLPSARQGAGGVHHVAFRTPNDEEYQGWLDKLARHRIASSGAVDRYYFKSLYFRDPNGILFEIATDGPGFASDEPMETMGQKLSLPPFLEPHRKDIEAGLKPL